MQLIAAAKRALYPEAVIVHSRSRGRMKCRSCKKIGDPRLIEVGYSATHHLKSIEGTTITASGWGSTSDVSEEGDELMLECPHCFQMHRIPEAIEIDWV